MSICAYCKSDKKMTKEHIWPACIIKRTSYKMRYSENANKVLNQVDLVVKDVCVDCNNGALSKLDAYACDLFDKYFGFFHKANEIVNFDFEDGKLRRWLLKVSYNCARSSKLDTAIFEPFLNYILFGGEPSEEMSIMVEILAAERTESDELVLPESARCGRVKFEGKEFKGVQVRMVSINSFCFYLVFQTEYFSSMPQEVALDFISTIRGKLIHPSDNSIEIRVSAAGASSFHKGLFSTKKALFEDFMEKNLKNDGDDVDNSIKS